MPGLVETSTNLASVKMIEDDTVKIVTSQRSSVESANTTLRIKWKRCLDWRAVKLHTETDIRVGNRT